MLGAERGRLLREDEDVLVALAAERPGEWPRRLRDQLHTIEIEFGKAGCENAIAFRFLLRGKRLVHGEAADIGDDRRTFCLWEKFLQAPRDVDHGLGLLQRIAPQAFV